MASRFGGVRDLACARRGDQLRCTVRMGNDKDFVNIDEIQIDGHAHFDEGITQSSAVRQEYSLDQDTDCHVEENRIGDVALEVLHCQ